jgi:hypothetical protein
MRLLFMLCFVLPLVISPLWQRAFLRGVVFHAGTARPPDRDIFALPWGWMVPKVVPLRLFFGAPPVSL